jgi:hypothetical protein
MKKRERNRKDNTRSEKEGETRLIQYIEKSERKSEGKERETQKDRKIKTRIH